MHIQPDYHKAWINRGSAAKKSTSRGPFLANLSLIAKQNPELNKRGYEGALVSFRQGLKYVHKNTQPESWGVLHQNIGIAHYDHWKYRQRENAQYWKDAINEYNKAYKTLKDFPERHLDLLQGFIRAYLDFGTRQKRVEAEKFKKEAWNIFQDLLEKQINDNQKSLFSLKYAWLGQLTVDINLQKGELIKAWEIAEREKNACLTWLLSGWATEIDSPSYKKIQKVLTPSTAIIYWHISPNSLNTFILKHELEAPIVKQDLGRSKDQLKEWVKNWNREYEEQNTSWQNNLSENLQELKDILQIDAIVEELTSITNLILIPHQELHLLPLNFLFPYDFTITYLPCAQLALNPTKTKFSLTKDDKIFSLECPANLDFAEMESEIICQIFSHSNRISGEKATEETVKTELSQPHELFHFTGHGYYDFNSPKDSALQLIDEEKLTLEKILQIPLPEKSYKIVTLSACETALTGTQSITTEYVGLVSGFMRWGTAYVLSTQWIVEDAPNALVIIQFYRLLLEDNSITPPLALAKATQWLRELTFEELKNYYHGLQTEFPDMKDEIHGLLRHQRNIVLMRKQSGEKTIC
ncbi:MAG: CHAT domain-containing protein [Pleurocapsa sp. CRU_1_2]|nr:CHAT domain-containing protein [Pleurocapsa sp. CRU_1_2]